MPSLLDLLQSLCYIFTITIYFIFAMFPASNTPLNTECMTLHGLDGPADDGSHHHRRCAREGQDGFTTAAKADKMVHGSIHTIDQAPHSS
jgi:hypothetical protein